MHITRKIWETTSFNNGLVAVNYLGETRWGNENQYVYICDGEYWAVDIETPSGDGEYTSFDDVDDDEGVEAYRVEPMQVTVTKWVEV